MKRILLIFILIPLIGCTTTNQKGTDQGSSLQSRIVELERIMSEKDQTILQLQEVLKQQEVQIQDKDQKIESLIKRLESFGVFEK